MNQKTLVLAGSLFLAVLVVAGVTLWAASGGDEGGLQASASGELALASESAQAQAWEEGDPLEMTVYMSPTCGCCGAWVEHMEEHGFEVEVRHREDMFGANEYFGIPRPLASCHTALINGFLMEGHVPAEDVRAFLAEAPEGARGLTVPAMPVGSPGMEMGGQVDPYDVLVMHEDGRTTVFSSHP